MREKVKLDPEKVNIMRLSMTDLEIRKELWTSTVNINNQCWTRRKNRIPFIQRNLVTKKWKPTLHKPVIDERKLMKEQHPEPIKGNYWEDTKKFWKVCSVWFNPHPFIINKIK